MLAYHNLYAKSTPQHVACMQGTLVVYHCGAEASLLTRSQENLLAVHRRHLS